MAAMERSTQGVVRGAKLSDEAGMALIGIGQVSQELDSIECFGECTYLVHLDKYRVGTASFYSFAKILHVGYEQVVANELYLMTESFGKLPPAYPVVFCHTVFDTVYGVFLHKLGNYSDRKSVV